jgi:AraC-like DNA-binding protein
MNSAISLHSVIDDFSRRLDSGAVVRIPTSTARGVIPAKADAAHSFVENGRPVRWDDNLAEYHIVPEFFLQISGENLFEFPDGELRLAPGEALIMPRRLPHRERVSGNFRMLVVWFFRGEMHCSLTEAGARHTPHVIHDEVYDAEAAAPLMALLDAAGDAAVVPEAMRAVTKAFLLRLSHTLASKAQLRPGNPKVAQIRRFVSKNLGDASLAVTDIAGKLGCSPDYLSTLFNRETGMRLAEYILVKRLEESAALLRRDPDLPVATVATRCGFSSASYFCQRFREAYGKPPRQWRTSIKP